MRLYLGYEDIVLPDFSMISGGQFHADNRNGDSLNDGVWCQSATTGNMIGAWYLPNGTQLTTEDIDSPTDFPLYAYQETGQIGLVRDVGIIDYQGLYRCVIPDENGTDQTLWVAAYANTVFNSNGKST